MTWVGSGEKEGESFHVCLSAAQCWRGTVAEQGSAWSASNYYNLFNPADGRLLIQVKMPLVTLAYIRPALLSSAHQGTVKYQYFTAPWPGAQLTQSQSIRPAGSHVYVDLRLSGTDHAGSRKIP